MVIGFQVILLTAVEKACFEKIEADCEISKKSMTKRTGSIYDTGDFKSAIVPFLESMLFPS